MKIPLSIFISPLFKKYNRPLKFVCSPCSYGSYPYIVAYSLLGMLLTITDLHNLMKKGGTTPSSLSTRTPQPLFCPRLKAGLKMATSGLNFFIHLLLFFGTFYEEPVFLMPFLLLEAINISVFLLYIISAITFQKDFFSYWAIIVFCFMMNNWVQILCQFRGMLTPLDL